MPIETHIDPENGIRRHILSGEIRAEEIEAVLTEVASDPGFSAETPALWDLRGADNLISPDRIRSLASFANKTWHDAGHPRVALLTRRKVVFGLARMYEQFLSFRNIIQLRVFEEEDEAVAWLVDSQPADA